MSLQSALSLLQDRQTLEWPPCAWRLGQAETGQDACADWCVVVTASCWNRPGSEPQGATTLAPGPDYQTRNASSRQPRRSWVPADPSTPTATAAPNTPTPFTDSLWLSSDIYSTVLWYVHSVTAVQVRENIFNSIHTSKSIFQHTSSDCQLDRLRPHFETS